MRKYSLVRTIAGLALTIGLVGSAEAQRDGLKIYMSVDMEGVVGVVTTD